MISRLLTALLVATASVTAFTPGRPSSAWVGQSTARNRVTCPRSSSSGDDAEPTISEMTTFQICEELTVRGTDFSDCFEEEALRTRLTEAREERSALDVEVVVDDKPTKDSADEYKDVPLPAGLTPEAAATLMSRPEIRDMISTPGFQELMADVMGSGPDASPEAKAEAMQKHMDDPNKREMLSTLTALLVEAGMAPNKPTIEI